MAVSNQSANPWQSGSASQNATTNANPWASSGTGTSAPSAGQTSASQANGGTAGNPWGAGAGSGHEAAGHAATQHAAATPSWLNDAPAAQVHHFSIWHPFHETVIPLAHWVQSGLDWVVNHFRPFFHAIRWPVDVILSDIQWVLQHIPAPVLIVLFCLAAWQLAGRRLALGTLISLIFVGLIGAWQQAMITLALVFTSVIFCVIIGLPMGIWLSRSEGALSIFRPLLDAMQTTPAFVYLVPIVMLFGIGNVPGVVVTIIFALPPLIRLTNLGIRQVPGDLVEASRSFGASPKQLLFKVQIPLAMPTIMAGINQTLMLSLSMVVIASMIAVAGLGQMVLRGIGQLDMGLATVGGVGIVILAVILDRLTQALGQDQRDRAWRHWYEHGPVGLLIGWIGSLRNKNSVQ